MNFQGFIDSLSFMGIGMASIIIVIGVLVISVLLLNLFTSKKVKTSRKIIFVSALVVLIVGVSLLNGIRMEKAVKEYVEENEEKIITIFKNNFGASSLETELEAQGRGFVITFIDEAELSDEEKEEIQKLFDNYEPYFEEMLTEIKKDIKELKTFEFRVCDKNGNTYISVVADGK